ncbi:MAG: RecX family transcriptional regulator [Clostridia bacterium]|nr:RecX family transcriptional regulator [Clostridia bacterium]
MILITQVRPYRRTKLFEVYSETGLEFLANEKFLLDFSIRPYAEYSEEEFEPIRARALLLDGIRKAVDILSRKDYSKKELLRKLKEKGIPEEAAIGAVCYMEQRGYQDDYRYAKRLAELGKQSYGRARVEQMLYHHGIERDTVREVLEEVFQNDEDEHEKIDRIFASAARGKDLTDPAARNKVYAKLVRLGYSSSAVSAAFSRYKSAGKDELD